MIAIASASFGAGRANAAPLQAQGGGGIGGEWLEDGAFLQAIYNQVETAELLQLAADFHGALSYNGDPAMKSANLTTMSNLWVAGSSLTFSNTVTGAASTYTGKDAVMSFFATGGYFVHNWVSLAPEYKTQVTVHGNKAEISTQCVGIDLTATPKVVVNVIQVLATAERRGDHWFFTSMHNSSPAPL